MEAILGESQIDYARDFRVADAAISLGRVASTTTERENFWKQWCIYAKGVDCDPYLQGESFNSICRTVTGFGGRVREGHYGRGRQVSCPRVQTAIRAIGQTCELDLGKTRYTERTRSTLNRLS